jgi:CBS domain-containing protein
MLTVGDIMTAGPITIAPHATLREAVDLLAANGISGLPVITGRTVVGTLSASNIIDFESTARNVPTERGGDGVEDSSSEDDYDATPGYFVDMWDDSGVDVIERIRCADTPEWDFLSQHLVMDAMSTSLTTFSPLEGVDRAAQYMRRTGAHRALVVEGDVLLGIVTTMDVTRAVADHLTER